MHRGFAGPNDPGLSSRLDEARVHKETPRDHPVPRTRCNSRNPAPLPDQFSCRAVPDKPPLLDPQIVNSSGLSRSMTDTGFLVMIPYALSAVIMYLWARHSDRLSERRWHVAVPLAVAAIFLILLSVPHTALTGFILLSGCDRGIVCRLCPVLCHDARHIFPRHRASGVALVNAIASVGSFAGPVLALPGGNIGNPGTVVLFLILGIALIACAILLVGKGLRVGMRGDKGFPAFFSG